MRHTTEFIHCSKEGKPLCEVSINNPMSVRIYNEKTSTDIFLFLDSLQDLVNFKNSFLSSYEKAMRRANYDK